jgi:hypothetical protein
MKKSPVGKGEEYDYKKALSVVILHDQNKIESTAQQT